MTELHFTEYSALIALIDDLPEDDVPLDTLKLRDKLVTMQRELLNRDD